MRDLNELLASARQGDVASVDQLCALMYDDLRRLARIRLAGHQRGTLLDTTALVHESYLRLSKLETLDVEDRSHFMRYAGRVMRSVIVDFVRVRLAERRGGDVEQVTLDTSISNAIAHSEGELIRINEALDELAKVDERMVRVVELKYFVGLDEREIATSLGIAERTVRRDWEKARLMLKAALS